MSSRNLESYISFPGLGIGEFKIDSVALNIFGYEIVWYGIIITLGIIAAVCYVLWRAKQEHISTDDVLDLAIYVVLGGLVGARLYYVLTSLDSYVADSFTQTLYNFVAVWKGGLAIYGGLIGGAIAAVIVVKIKKINLLRVFDMVGPAAMIGQLIGRWGNFFNAEAFGDATDLPWRMGIRNKYHTDTIFVHPTFLYESLWNLVGFIIINLLYKKKKFDGQVFLMYVAWYGLGRMFIEGLRADSLYVGSIRISQLVAFVTCIIAVIAIIVVMALAKQGKTKPTAYMEAASVSMGAAGSVTADKAIPEQSDTADNVGSTDKAKKDESNGDGSKDDGKNN